MSWHWLVQQYDVALMHKTVTYHHHFTINISFGLYFVLPFISNVFFSINISM